MATKTNSIEIRVTLEEIECTILLYEFVEASTDESLIKAERSFLSKLKDAQRKLQAKNT